jgi:hypothetical protein
MTTENLETPPAGWFVLDVMRKKAHAREWVALMIDVHPNEYRAGFFLHTRECFVNIQGTHRSRDAAWDVLESLMATRH